MLLVSMRWWSLLACALWCAVGARGGADLDPWGGVDHRTDLTEGADHRTDLRANDATCVRCSRRHIVSVNNDFNKLETDPQLKHHVSAILDRLKTFKIPVHPRIRIFYELLKVGMSEHAHRTADSLYVPDKYNVRVDVTNKP